MTGAGGKAARDWSDLRARAASALVMLAVGAVEVWLGGWPFAALVILASAAMIWELARMTQGAGTLPPLVLAAIAGLALFGVEVLPAQAPGRFIEGLSLALMPALLGLIGQRRLRRAFLPYAVLVMLTGHALISLRADPGIGVILWILAVVIVSDVAGYFAGRSLGGPKFWPAISPKKTWSGTVAGWVGAALVGALFWAMGWGGAGLIWLSPLVAFAGQMGDIWESWIKRRTGIKDSSNLIPGHGGVMDRFDALATAAVLVWAVALVLPLPLPLVAG